MKYLIMKAKTKIEEKTGALMNAAKLTLGLWLTSATLAMCTTPAYASIADSKIGTGLNKLITDLSAYLKIISPITMIVLLVYFFIRKGMADEMDAKKWNSRITTAIVCCVGAFVASVIVDLAQGYFGK